LLPHSSGNDVARFLQYEHPSFFVFVPRFLVRQLLVCEREWVPVQVMEKAAETILRLSEIWAEKSA